jgi:hypothetical protein
VKNAAEVTAKAVDRVVDIYYWDDDVYEPAVHYDYGNI